MDRDAFILALIGELEKQQQLSPELSKPDLSPAEIFEKLQFDYPDIEDADIDRLSHAIKSITAGPAPEWLYLSPKFVENMKYLITHKCSAGVVRLVRAVYLTLPLYLLRCDQRELSVAFKRDDTSAWPDLMQSFAEFSYSSRVLVLSLKNTEEIQMQCPVDTRDFTPLIKLLSLLRIAVEAKPDDLLSCEPSNLLEYLSQNTALTDAPEGGEVKGVITQAVSMELLFHWGYLLRDIMAQQPSSIIYWPVPRPSTIRPT